MDLQHGNASCIAHLSIHLSQLGRGKEHQNLHNTKNSETISKLSACRAKTMIACHIETSQTPFPCMMCAMLADNPTVSYYTCCYMSVQHDIYNNTSYEDSVNHRVLNGHYDSCGDANPDLAASLTTAMNQLQIVQLYSDQADSLQLLRGISC